MHFNSFVPTFYFMLFALGFNPVSGADMDITKAGVLVTSEIDRKMHDAIWEIIDKELGAVVKWDDINTLADSRINIIITTNKATNDVFQFATDEIMEKRNNIENKEGFYIAQNKKGNQHTIWLITNNGRSVIFALGALLRASAIDDGRIIIDDRFELLTSPKYAIRGHQIGYRNTANSYDAWSAEQYETYIRELALFGTNAIENIPLGSTGDDSPHMQLSRSEMNRKISAICDLYDLDYWVWTPATFDLRDSVKRAQALKDHEDFYKDCPRLNNIFFPGGDPGHNHPREVLPFLKELSFLLERYHPGAGIWISLQGFSQEQIDYFYEYLDQNKPTWLKGVVSGPSSPALSDTRYRLPARYQHRHYPDITHNVRCDYPTPDWDQAFALTLGREACNPQPYFYAGIHEKYAVFTDGFISYSDGAHDDINKIIWSQRGWDPTREVRDILVDYCQYFFGSDMAEKTADGILGLERNWAGPLIKNGGVETTFAYWQQLELDHPALQSNWRWQLLVMRAYYDTYIRRRLVNEQTLEIEANKVLMLAAAKGSKQVMKEALHIMKACERNPIARQLKAKLLEYGELLFKSIGLQTRLEAHQASGVERGCILDFIDYPLNNRWWYEDQFKKIDSLQGEKEKIDHLSMMATWGNPGPGSYYDDISNVANSPHVKTTVSDATDFAWWANGFSRARLSWQTFQKAPVLEYQDLDPAGRYILRVCGYGEALARVDNQRLEPIQYEKEIGQFKEFIIPRGLVGDGQIRVTFDQPEESDINWRNHSRVSDVWLIKK